VVDDLFALALEHSPESVSIYGLDGTVIYMNRVTERIMGVSFADLKGKRLFELYPDAIETAFGKAFTEAARGDEPADFTHYYPLFDGWYANHVVRIGDRVHVYARDVTADVRRQRRLDTLAEVERERRDAERRATARLQNLLALTARLAAARSPEELIRELVDGGRAAMDSMATTLWQLTADGRNAQLVRASGTLTWQLSLGDMLPLEEAGPVATCLRTGEAVWVVGAADRAARYPNLDSSPPPDRPIPDAIAVVPLSTDGVKSCLGFSFVDALRLTSDDRTYLEILASNGAEALRRAFALEELRASATSALRARTEAESANRAKDEFLAMLGHELRNPLAPLVTALELMRMRGDDKFERERAVIGRQVQHLSRLVDDLLDVSRITRGKIELRRERITLFDVINKAVEQTSPLFDERRHHLAVNVPSDLLIHGDATRLAQVFGNLLSNAAKYTPRGGRVEVTARGLPGELVCVTVRDDGIGIPPSILPHVFDLFVQAPQSSERPAGGLGLGLTIVRSLVELHSGTVSVASEGPGRGTEFTVVLPSAITPALATGAPSALPDIKSLAARRVLVVDDNEDAAMMLADMLDAYGHEIRTAFDGPSALRIADEFHPEVAVLDIGLPVMDGYELAQRLRATPELAEVRLIAVTGYGQESDRRRSLEAGFQAHLAKPVQIDELVQLVEHG
jgi:signal transduction histidine kinase